ncbi:hypothetical protein ACQ3G6_09605 [Allorhizobium undicola]|uniref:hypothetical protein n=1 Tax=Allorhizobium undicola TaxID=78527 RepID=UPI0012B652DD|nr:hypothetical protein [Allorhizobium undicola]
MIDPVKLSDEWSQISDRRIISGYANIVLMIMLFCKTILGARPVNRGAPDALHAFIFRISGRKTDDTFAGNALGYIRGLNR